MGHKAMEYQNINELREAHIRGDFWVPKHLTIEGVHYTLAPVSHTLHEVLLGRTDENDTSNCAILYTINDPQQITEGYTDQWLVPVYSFNENNHLVPSDVRGITPGDVINEENKIGDTVSVQIANVPSGATVRATVDTGATYSSLHADKWDVKGNQVHFVSKALSDNVITMPLETQQAVKSPGDDVEYRPVISLNLRINGEMIKDQLFNLSDRGEMDNPMLLGQNTLEDGNFVIDPKMDENVDIDWNLIEQEIKGIKPPQVNESTHTSNISDNQVNEQKARQVYEALREADVTFEDIIKVIHADALRTMEDISY